MPLDFCLLSSTGHPDLTVGLSPDEHAALFQLVEGSSVLSRASNYYGDAEFSASEASRLLKELQAHAGAQLAFLRPLEHLCVEAIRRGCGISVLADWVQA